MSVGNLKQIIKQFLYTVHFLLRNYFYNSYRLLQRRKTGEIWYIPLPIADWPCGEKCAILWRISVVKIRLSKKDKYDKWARQGGFDASQCQLLQRQWRWSKRGWGWWVEDGMYSTVMHRIHSIDSSWCIVMRCNGHSIDSSRRDAHCALPPNRCDAPPKTTLTPIPPTNWSSAARCQHLLLLLRDDKVPANNTKNKVNIDININTNHLLW